MAIHDLRQNDMMAHLLDALEQGQDVGHYGRLTFVMVGQHFLDDDELTNWLMKDPAFDERQARGLIDQVRSRDYSPPRPERIREWQAQQGFRICPSDDPTACNVYRNLRFPDDVYQRINEFHQQKAST